MDPKNMIEIVLAFAVAIAPIAVLLNRYFGDSGIGARAIQFLAVSMLVPTLSLLALEGKIEPATLGTIIGALIGYLLSGIGEYKPGKKSKAKRGESVNADR